MRLAQALLGGAGQHVHLPRLGVGAGRRARRHLQDGFDVLARDRRRQEGADRAARGDGRVDGLLLFAGDHASLLCVYFLTTKATPSTATAMPSQAERAQRFAEHQPGHQRRRRRRQVQQARDLGGVVAADEAEQQEDGADRQRQDRPQQRAHELRRPVRCWPGAGPKSSSSTASGSSSQRGRRELDHGAGAQVELRAEALLVQRAGGDRQQRQHAQRDRGRRQRRAG